MSRPDWATLSCTLPYGYVLTEPEALHAPLVDILNALGDGIRECVCFGTHVLAWCLEEAEKVETEEAGTAQAVAILRLRYALEFLLAVECQVRSCVPDPAWVTIRSLFEQRLYLAYLLKADTIKRAYAFFVCHHHERLDHLRWLGTTEARRHFENEGLPLPTSPAREPKRLADIQHLTDLLANPPTAAGQQARNEYQRIFDKSKRKPEWYSFFRGPSNIFELARHLDLAASYKIFYRHWSLVAHGGDILRRAKFGKGEGVTVYQLRHPEDLQDVTLHAMMQAFQFFRVIVPALVPQREGELGKWYLAVQPTIQRLMHSTRLLNIED